MPIVSSRDSHRLCCIEVVYTEVMLRRFRVITSSRVDPYLDGPSHGDSDFSSSGMTIGSLDVGEYLWSSLVHESRRLSHLYNKHARTACPHRCSMVTAVATSNRLHCSEV